MNLQICTNKGEDLLLRDVSTYLVDSDMLHVLFNDGRQQNYPLLNVRWYGPEEPVFAPTRRLRHALDDTLDLTDMDLSDFVGDSDDAHEYSFNHPTPTDLLDL